MTNEERAALVGLLRRTYHKEYAPTRSTVGNNANRLRPFPILAVEVPFNPDGPEAADLIEGQAKRIAELEAALVKATSEINALKDALAQVDGGNHDD